MGEYGERTPPTLKSLTDGLEIHKIPMTVELNDIICVKRDTVIRVRLGVKAQGLGTKALNATGGASVVNLIEVVMVAGLFADAFQVGFTDDLNSH